MNITPIGNRVLIEPLRIEERTTSGIILPISTNTDVSNKAKIIAIGNITEKLSVGDTIIFNPNSGVKVSTSEKSYLIVEANDILALIK